MQTSVKPIPDGYHSITPCLIVNDASRILDFVKQAFEAQEIHRTTGRDGCVQHAEVRIGDSVVMISQAHGEWRAMTAALYLYVPDTDALYRRALQAGGTSLQEPTDHFYGDRSGGVTDPCGNQWFIATHVEDVSDAELQRRSQERG
jgi:PhnB protein